MVDYHKDMRPYRKYIICYLLVCLFFFILVEMIHRPNILDFKNFLFSTNPLTLCYLLLFFIFSSFYVFIFNKPIIFCVVHYSYWCVLSIVSNINSYFRHTPLIFEDIFLISEATEIASKYLNKNVLINFSIILILILCLILILVKSFYNFKFSILKFKSVFLNLFFGVAFLSVFIISSEQLLNFGNLITKEISDFDLIDTYSKNGFLYSFYKSTENFIESTNYSNYDKNKIIEIKNLLGKQDIKQTTPNENIILIQLESIFDPLKLNGVEFSKDPLKNFRNLMENNISGEIIVPVLGGGTTQTEFEILTGLEIKNLFTNMPYLNLLNHNKIESVATIFKNYGYSTTSIHNYFSNFYNRIEAYENLGFDSFIPLETMSNRIRNDNFWYKDSLIIDEIEKRILNTKEKDFIFGVTVEAHGPYNTKINGDIKVKSSILNEKERSELENYANIIKETDNFITELINRLDKIKEEYVLIIYSDHLPTLGNKYSTFDKTLPKDDLFKTPYLIITSDKSRDLKLNKQDFHSYEFLGNILESLNLNTTIYHKFKKEFRNIENINEYEKQLILDIKYKNIYDNGIFPYLVENIKIGNELPKIQDAVVENNISYIIGNNFTPNSKIVINEDVKDSAYISENYLRLENYVLKNGDNVKVSTFSNKNSPLNSSESFKFLN